MQAAIEPLREGDRAGREQNRRHQCEDGVALWIRIDRGGGSGRRLHHLHVLALGGAESPERLKLPGQLRLLDVAWLELVELLLDLSDRDIDASDALAPACELESLRERVSDFSGTLSACRSGRDDDEACVLILGTGGCAAQ